MTTPIIILLLYLYYNTGNKNLEMKKEKNFVIILLVKKMYTISKNTSNEIIIKNSRFITLLYKIKKPDEVPTLLDTVRKTYPKATHYCYAYKIEDNIKKASDDGEPSGTAGLPMLNVLEKEDITNTLAITIRYFGGIKLGAGGLIRAYSKSVKETLKTIHKKELVPAYLCKLTFPYSKEKEITRLLKDEQIIEKNYLEEITYTVILRKDFNNLELLKPTILESKTIEKD